MRASSKYTQTYIYIYIFFMVANLNISLFIDLNVAPIVIYCMYS